MALKENELVKDFNFADLIKAYYDCRKHKRRTNSALKFEIELEKNLLKLYHDLKSGKYKIGKYICFVVTSPKPREVWAANFRDRIVHHLVYNAIKDRFYKRFINDTYSCIPKRGTLSAAKRMLKFTRSSTRNYKKKVYYLKADLSNFFVSIDKDILFNLVKKYVDEEWILELVKKIIYHNPKNNVFIKTDEKTFKLLPAHKSLWNTNDKYGLPIGNLTSQFFSNVYLDVLDQFVKRNLGCKYYARYVDDFIILDYSPSKLINYKRELMQYLKQSLGLKLNNRKCYINSVNKGMDFVGYKLKPHRLYLRQKTINKAFNTIWIWLNNKNRLKNTIITEFLQTINSYLGMLKNTCSYNLRKELCFMFNSFFIYPDNLFLKACTIQII